ncbi:hypothetical protein BB561_003234 [Smittium simulii]|uniref:CCHC-type domain-containing protein n=1 Tax=Smittium simulii TaxID=133385 RepID=A0A2T9YMF2_9FUNG|nr:hypothetical protein BB561_003234 [Smittium simulii]
MFKGLSEKFTGNPNAKLNVATWIDKFKLVSELKAWDKSTQIKVLELWLEDQAYEWFKKFKEKSSKTSIQVLLAALKKEFTVVSTVSLCELFDIELKANEKLIGFNDRFLKLWSSIPALHYTEEMVQETYLSKISKVDREIWWKLAEHAGTKSPRLLIEELTMFAKLKEKYDNKLEQLYKIGVRLNKEYNEIVSKSKHADPIDELTQSINELILINKKALEPKRVTTVCQNCGKIGHLTEHCFIKKKKPEEKIVEKQQTSMLALSSQDNDYSNNGVLNPPNPLEVPIVAAVEIKRMRVESLLNNQENNQARRIIMGPIIQKPQNFLKKKPDLIKSMAEEIKLIDRNTSKSYLLYNIDIIEDGPKTFILTKIVDKEVPIFIDTGAMNSIIDYKVLDVLKIAPLKLEIEVEKDVLIPSKFLVMRDCAVPVLWGMNVLQDNKVNINYSNNVLTFGSSTKCAIQLYSKEDLENLEESDWDSDKSEYTDNLTLYASVIVMAVGLKER